MKRYRPLIVLACGIVVVSLFITIYQLTPLASYLPNSSTSARGSAERTMVDSITPLGTFFGRSSVFYPHEDLAPESLDGRSYQYYAAFDDPEAGSATPPFKWNFTRLLTSSNNHVLLHNLIVTDSSTSVDMFVYASVSKPSLLSANDTVVSLYSCARMTVTIENRTASITTIPCPLWLKYEMSEYGYQNVPLPPIMKKHHADPQWSLHTRRQGAGKTPWGDDPHP
ncbi:MAG: hypothetical protein FWD75_05010 [Propionibacteriaceae bacterium]|nr:hypothetical protein [Propionibacteriaceae bacterium]